MASYTAARGNGQTGEGDVGEQIVVSDSAWRGQLGPMQSDEVDAFLREPVFARLATVDGEGWPYAVPVWHAWFEHCFWLVGRRRSTWAAYLVDEPRCAVTVDEAGGQRKVIAQCRARVVEEPNVGGRWVEIAREMSVRYLGEHGPDYLEPTLSWARWLFALEPVRMWTWQGNDWAPKYKVG